MGATAPGSLISNGESVAEDSWTTWLDTAMIAIIEPLQLVFSENVQQLGISLTTSNPLKLLIFLRDS